MTKIEYQAQYRYDHSDVGIEIPIVLMFGDSEVRLLAKVDTGSQFCIFQRDYAERLGIVVENGIRTSILTAGGTRFDVFGHDVTMSCLEWEFATMVYFAESPGFNRNVVGRTGWLQKCRFALIEYDSMLYLSHYDD